MLNTYVRHLLCAFLFFSAAQATVGEYTWQFTRSTSKWENTTLSDTWTLGGYTFTKSGGSNTPSGGFVEAWTFNPLNTRWTEANSGSSSWSHSGVGQWTENTASETWSWHAPTTSDPRGTWQLGSSGAVWSYNETNQIWEEAGTSNTKYFPPFLPSQVIIQHQEILSAYDYLTTREIPDSTTNISWTDGFETITYDYDAGTWTFSLPEYAPTYNTTPEWKDNVAISGGTSYTERWTAAENSDTTKGRTFTHESSGLSGGETINYNSATATWTYASSSEHSWQFDPEAIEWTNLGTQARYEYDTRERKWVQVDAGTPLRVWQSKKDSTQGWVWHDTVDDIMWQYTSGVWENLSTNATYFASNAKLEDDGGDTWTYAPAAWTKDGTSDTDHLFPLLPPNPAGQLGRIQQQGYLLAQEHLTTGDSFATSYASQKGTFDSAIANRGTSRVSAVETLDTPAEELAASITPWQTKYLQLANPHHTATHVFAPVTSGDFHVWNKIGWRFPEAGKAVIFFKGKGAGKLSVGFSVTPPTDASALYSIIAQATSITSTIHDASSQLASVATSSFIADGTNWYDYWLSYNNGVLQLGTGTRADSNHVVLTYDLTGNTDIDKIRFFSFAAQSGTAFEFKDIRCAPYDPAVSFANATDLALRVSDEVAIGTWQNTYDSHKGKLNNIESDVTPQERKTTLDGFKTAVDTIKTEVETTKTATDTNGYEATDALDSPSSRAAFDEVYNEITRSHSIASDYATVVTHITTVENEVIDLFLELENNLTESAFTTKRDTAATTIETTLDTLITLLTNMKNTAVSLQASPSNSDLSLMLNTVKEELAIANVQKQALPYFKERMLLKYYQANPSSSALTQLININTATSNASTAKNALAESLATDLANGDITMYSAVVGMVAMSVKQTMAQVRSQTSTQLSTDTQIHDFPTTGHTYATASTNQTSILSNQVAVQSELETTVVPLLLTSDPGTDKPAEKSIAQLVSEGKVTESISSSGTTSITDQELETSAGTAETPNVTVISEGAVIQELKVDTTDKTAAHLQIRTKSAEVSLGRSDLTKDSGKAVTVLGSSSLIPDSEGIVYLSSDIRVLANDSSSSNTSTPLKAGPDFGSATNDTRCSGTLRLAEKGMHKLEFRTTGKQQSIVVGRGVELNLTNFGKGDTPGGQRIVFGDNVSLVLLPGASIRFPYLEPTNADRAPILDFAGKNSRLIFEDPQNYDSTYWTNVKDGSDEYRNKLLGTGFIRMSGKNARMEILRGALVGCEGDYTSPRADIRIELTGENSRCNIGDESIAGGALQIGNFQDGGYNRHDTSNYPNNSTHSLFGDATTPFEPREQQIDFDILIDGPGAQLHIGREGFLGFGVGVVNKSGEPNGSTPDKNTDPSTDSSGESYNAWRVHSLYNVGSVKITILNGSLSHHSIGLGNEKTASVMAIGPINNLGAYQFQFNKSLTNPILPGGNVVYMHQNADGEVAEATPLALRIWDTITPSLVGNSDDNGKYSLLAPAPTIIGRKEADLVNTGSYTFGGGTITNTTSLFTFVGRPGDFYKLITMRSYIEDLFFVPIKKDGTSLTIPYITASYEVRHQRIQPRDVLTPDGTSVVLEKIGFRGYLEGRDGNTPPQLFTQK